MVIIDDLHGTDGEVVTLTFNIIGEEINNAPYNPTNIYPIHGAINIPSDVTLMWNGEDPDGDVLRYDVYFGTTENLNQNHKVASNITQESFTRSGLNFGTVYYWKIVSKDVLLSTEGPVWRFTTEIAPSENHAPTQPTNPVPQNNAINVDIDIGYLSWGQSSDPDGDTVRYDVYFGTNSNPTVKIASNILANQVNIDTLNYDTRYYWKVVATDSISSPVSSSVWTFLTKEQQPGENQPPLKPYAPDPEYGSVIDINKVFKWKSNDPDGDVLRYDLYIGLTEQLGQSDLIAENLNTDSHNVVGLNYETKYFWRVVVKDSHNSPVSGDVWRFTTKDKPTGNHAPTEPMNPSPRNGATGIKTDLTIRWDNSKDLDGDIVYYTVYFDDDNDLTENDIIAKKIRANSWRILDLDRNTKYYWKVVASDGIDSISGDIWNFKTKKDSNDNDFHPSGEDYDNLDDQKYQNLFLEDGEVEQQTADGTIPEIEKESKSNIPFILFGILLVLLVGILIIFFIYKIATK